MRYWEYLEKQRAKETRAAKRRRRESPKPVAQETRLSWMDRIILSSMAVIATLVIVAIILLQFGLVTAAHIAFGTVGFTLCIFVFSVAFDDYVIRASVRKSIHPLEPSFDEVIHA